MATKNTTITVGVAGSQNYLPASKTINVSIISSGTPLTDIVTSSKIINDDNSIIIYDPNTKDYAGDIIEWQVIGIDQDGQGTVTVQTKTLVGDGASGYGSAIGDRRYDPRRNILNSELQNWLDNDFYNHLGSDFRSKIIPVTKSITPYEDSNISSQQCKLFNLSVAEVGGGGGTPTYYSPEPGAFTYQYYQGIGSSSSIRMVHSGGSNSNWWLRSPYTSGVYGVWFVTSGVSSGGYLSGGISCFSTDYGPAPACVLPSNIKLEEDTNGKYKIVW